MFYYMLSERQESDREFETFMSDETKKQKQQKLERIRKKSQSSAVSHGGTAEFYDRLRSTWFVKLLEANGLAYGVLVYFFLVLPMFFFLCK